jgi:DNA-binding transcriptional LysR family regulator
MNIQQVRQFLHIARAGSIFKASEELYITPQALGKSLHNFEDELGAPVLKKTLGGMDLTALGYRILPIAETMLKSFDNCVSLMRSQVRQTAGTLSVSLEHIFSVQIIPPDLVVLPGMLEVKFNIADERKKCLNDVLTGKSDMAIAHRGGDTMGLEYIPIISEEPPVVLMREDHVLANKQILTVPDLRGVGHNWPLSINTGLANSYIAACISEGFYPNIVFETSDFDMLIKTILTQNLVHLTASFVFDEYLPRGITALPLIHGGLKVAVGFFTRPDNNDNPLIKSYIKAVTACYAR